VKTTKKKTAKSMVGKSMERFPRWMEKRTDEGALSVRKASAETTAVPLEFSGIRAL
jgi:hypothetical protein